MGKGGARIAALLAAIGANACSTVTAHAQTQLPGITVTTPSPVTPSPGPAQAPAAAPQPQPAQPTPDPQAGAGLRITPDQGFAAVTVMTPGQLLGQPSATLAMRSPRNPAFPPRRSRRAPAGR